MGIVDDSKDYTEESAKRTNPSWASAQPLGVARLMHTKEQAEKRLTANSKPSDDELNSKLKRESGSALKQR
jgi:hypothetical protein